MTPRPEVEEAMIKPGERIEYCGQEPCRKSLTRLQDLNAEVLRLRAALTASEQSLAECRKECDQWTEDLHKAALERDEWKSRASEIRAVALRYREALYDIQKAEAPRDEYSDNSIEALRFRAILRMRGMSQAALAVELPEVL